MYQVRSNKMEEPGKGFIRRVEKAVNRAGRDKLAITCLFVYNFFSSIHVEELYRQTFFSGCNLKTQVLK